MATEEDNKDAGADDPFAGWAEALEEQRQHDQAVEGPDLSDQGGPLAGDAARSYGDVPVHDINMVLDIPVQLSVELGRTKVPIKYILQLAQGSVVELDALAGEPAAEKRARIAADLRKAGQHAAVPGFTANFGQLPDDGRRQGGQGDVPALTLMETRKGHG